MQNLHQSTRDDEILHARRFSKDEHLLIKKFFVRNQKHEHRGELKVKIHVCFMLTTHKPIHEANEVWYSKDQEHLQILCESLFCLTKISNVAVVRILRLCWDKY
jgi:hypothetical protein